MLATICIVLAVIGLILVILSVLPVTSTFIPQGLHAGIALIVIGVVLYIILALFAHTPALY
jgi:hypothetical protein